MVLGILTVEYREPDWDGEASLDRIIANLEIENLRLVVQDFNRSYFLPWTLPAEARFGYAYAQVITSDNRFQWGNKASVPLPFLEYRKHKIGMAPYTQGVIDLNIYRKAGLGVRVIESFQQYVCYVTA